MIIFTFEGHDLVHGRTVDTNRISHDRPCSPGEPHCEEKQGAAMDSHRFNWRCSPGEPHCIPCNPVDPKCKINKV